MRTVQAGDAHDVAFTRDVWDRQRRNAVAAQVADMRRADVAAAWGLRVVDGGWGRALPFLWASVTEQFAASEAER